MNEELKCKKCGEKVTGNKLKVIEDGENISEIFCAKHFVEYCGESDIRFDLEIITKKGVYDYFSSDVAREIIKQYPKIAENFYRTIRKIIQSGEKRTK